jgi:hypothetical protein
MFIHVQIVGTDSIEVHDLGYHFDLFYLPEELPDIPENWGRLALYSGPPLHVCPCCVYFNEVIGKYVGNLYWYVNVPFLQGHQTIEAWGWVLADNVYPAPGLHDDESNRFHLDLLGLPVPHKESPPEDQRISRSAGNHFLGDPSPNPFNPATTISFSLKEAAAVHLAVYDVKGRLVRSFHDGDRLPAGQHSFTWNGLSDCCIQAGSGIYFLKFKAGDVSETKKLILLR